MSENKKFISILVGSAIAAILLIIILHFKCKDKKEKFIHPYNEESHSAIPGWSLKTYPGHCV